MTQKRPRTTKNYSPTNKKQKLISQYQTLKVVKTYTLEEIKPEEAEFWNAHVKFENRIARFGEPPEAKSVSVPEKKNEYQMVLRGDALQLFALIDSWKDEFYELNRIRDLGRVLWGSGGVGKSSLLFLVTQYCHTKGWVVVYLPTAPTMGDHFELECDRLLQTLQMYYGNDKVGNETIEECTCRSKSGSAGLCSVISKLSMSCTKPVLIAVDQWNVLIRQSVNTIGQVHQFVRQFSTFDEVGSGGSAVFLCAVSSQATSTLPETAFRDASQQNCSLTINPYDTDAFDSHLY